MIDMCEPLAHEPGKVICEQAVEAGGAALYVSAAAMIHTASST
jgi:hypothetical protein